MAEKVSRVNTKLYAKMHLRQVDTLIRLANIENGIGSMFNATIPKLINVVSADSQTLKTSAFGSVMTSVIDDVRTMLRKQFTEFVKRSHQSAVEVLDQSIPRRLFELMVPIEPRLEWVKPPRAGRLVFGYNEIKLVREDSFGIPAVLAKKSLTEEEKQKARLAILFPPPSQQDVATYLSRGRHTQGPNGPSFESWEARFDGLSRLITDKKLAFNEIVRGYSEGENPAQIRQRLEPIVGGIKASAQRIARTEGMRVAESIQRSTWDALGEMMVGAQVIAVLDERTRPEHATRNGRIYYRQPTTGQRSMAELPDLPDAPNCRCMTIPVLSPPEEFATDPAIRDAFKQTANSGTGEPVTYIEWFADAAIAKRKMVTGVARYNSVETALAGTREPKWTDFIDGDGNLLPVDFLANESAFARTVRTQAIEKEIERQGQALLSVQQHGFVALSDSSQPIPPSIASVAPATVSPPSPKFIERIKPSIAKRKRNNSAAKKKAGASGLAVITDLETRVTATAVRQQIDFFNVKTQDVTEIRQRFLDAVKPDSKTVKEFEEMKAAWSEASSRTIEIAKTGDIKAATMFKVEAANKLKRQYGEDAFYRMLAGKPPASTADIHKELAMAINPAGSTKKNVQMEIGQVDEKLRINAETAQDWLNSIIPDDSPINVNVIVKQQNGRAYASPARSIICMRPDNSVAVHVHEIAHIIEAKTGETGKAAKAIRWAETVGQKTVHLKSESDNFDDSEITFGEKFKGLDDLRAKYVSKYYTGDNYTEIVSIGLEELYRDPTTLAQQNPDYFDFLVNVLKGSYAE